MGEGLQQYLIDLVSNPTPKKPAERMTLAGLTGLSWVYQSVISPAGSSLPAAVGDFYPLALPCGQRGQHYCRGNGKNSSGAVPGPFLACHGIPHLHSYPGVPGYGEATGGRGDRLRLPIGTAGGSRRRGRGDAFSQKACRELRSFPVRKRALTGAKAIDTLGSRYYNSR